MKQLNVMHHFVLELTKGETGKELHMSDPSTFQGVVNGYRTSNGNKIAMYSVTKANIRSFKNKHPSATEKFPDDLPDTVKAHYAETGVYIDMDLKRFYEYYQLRDILQILIQTEAVSLRSLYKLKTEAHSYALENGVELTLEYISAGVSGSVLGVTAEYEGNNYQYAVKIQTGDCERREAEEEYLKKMSIMAENGQSYTAWMIDVFSTDTVVYDLNTSVFVMMRANGVLYDLMKDHSTSDEVKTITIKHALVSLYYFHKEATHGDAHGSNYFYFNVPIEATVVNGLELPASEKQIILYDPGLAGKNTATVLDMRYGIQAINKEEYDRSVEPLERMNLDYRQTLAASAHWLNQSSALAVTLTNTMDFLMHTNLESSFDMLKACFGFLDGNNMKQRKRQKVADLEQPPKRTRRITRSSAQGLFQIDF